jgi:hypothetical protein
MNDSCSVSAISKFSYLVVFSVGFTGILPHQDAPTILHGWLARVFHIFGFFERVACSLS